MVAIARTRRRVLAQVRIASDDEKSIECSNPSSDPVTRGGGARGQDADVFPGIPVFTEAHETT